MPNGLGYTERVILTLLKEAEEMNIKIESEDKLQMILFLVDFYDPSRKKLGKYPVIDLGFILSERGIPESEEVKYALERLYEKGYVFQAYRYNEPALVVNREGKSFAPVDSDLRKRIRGILEDFGHMREGSLSTWIMGLIPRKRSIVELIGKPIEEILLMRKPRKTTA